jgi:hypothetical protein
MNVKKDVLEHYSNIPINNNEKEDSDSLGV